MFDLAINTTLESNPSRPNPSFFSVEIKDPNKSFQKEIKIVIFLRFMHIAFSPVNRKRRSSFRCLTI
ncbi:hypothetical protein GQ457_02G043100 [Hibiscus cannabinus]